MTKDEALKLALEALELSKITVDSFDVQRKTQKAIKALEEAIAKQEHEWAQGECVKCGASIEQEHLKPLTDEQKIALCKQFPDSLTFDAIAAIEEAVAKQEQRKCDNCGEFGECCQKQSDSVGEPVAWSVVGDGKFGMYELGHNVVEGEETRTYWENRGYELVPLYTAPL
jgi:glutamine synthetase adenylyltransferase